jgi:hypothetical protein
LRSRVAGLLGAVVSSASWDRLIAHPRRAAFEAITVTGSLSLFPYNDQSPIRPTRCLATRGCIAVIPLLPVIGCFARTPSTLAVTAASAACDSGTKTFSFFKIFASP